MYRVARERLRAQSAGCDSTVAQLRSPDPAPVCMEWILGGVGGGPIVKFEGLRAPEWLRDLWTSLCCASEENKALGQTYEYVRQNHKKAPPPCLPGYYYHYYYYYYYN